MGIRLAAKGTVALVAAGPEDIAGLGDMRVGLDIEVDLEDMDMVAGVIHPGSVLAGLYIRPEGPFDCCTPSQAPGYMLAILLLLGACQPPHSSSAHRLWERVL